MNALKKTLVMLLIPALILPGCGKGAAGASTPELCFAGFKQAMLNKDFKTGFTFLTVESQDALLSIMMLPIGLMTMFDPTAAKDVEPILSRHGIDLKSMGDNTLANVKDKGACFQDIMTYFEAKAGATGGDNPFDPKNFDTELTDLKIDGSTASGTVGKDTIHFKQIDGNWLIDLAQSMPKMNAGAGNLPDFEFPSDDDMQDAPNPFENLIPQTE